MPVKSYREAINEAMAQEMRRDPTVIVIGEDVAGGAGCEGERDAYGGVMGVTKGLFPEFGESRVIDTPITESAIMGAAAGAAQTGLRPIAELMFMDFLGVCFDQIYNQAAKFRYMFGGKAQCPMVVRTMAGAGLRGGAQHSQNLTQMVTMVPGLKVVCPTNAYDAKGLLTRAIRDNDCVIFVEDKFLYETSCEVPDEPYEIPFGEANFYREGTDVTIVGISNTVNKAIAVADRLSGEGISCDVIDPRTTSPLDEEAIIESVETTGRLVVVDEMPPRCGIAADIASMVAEKAFGALRAPIRKVTAAHSPIPFAPDLEDAWMPQEADIESAVRDVLGYVR
jgi:pyruvate dehydrogenase E1 component beta subunit